MRDQVPSERVRRFWLGCLVVLLATALALWATVGTSLGFGLWHYNAAIVGVALGALPLAPLLRRRRVVALALLYTGLFATLTGFVMLYTRQFPYKEWITWWHSAASFAFLAAFLLHWLHNHARLHEFARRLLRRERVVGWPTMGAWTLALVGAGLAASAAGRDLVYRENYRYVSTWTILIGIAGVYGTWLAFRWPALRARLAETEFRNRTRAMVDTSLWLACWLSLLTGIALVYVQIQLQAAGLRYVGKWWHTATSVAFLAFAVLHVGFNARLLAAHARRVERDLARAGPSRE